MVRLLLACAVLGTFANLAAAHDHADHGAKGEAFGRAGDPQKVSRTIALDLSDAMRFAPDELVVNQGETVRFRLENSGKIMHEMVLGTMRNLEAHAQVMRKDSGVHHHGAANMVHVAPGKTAELVWQFTNPGEFHYGCLVPGHFEAGMRGRITVAP
jgi:uncharacterized cupredoxin-like copper-binding protein